MAQYSVLVIPEPEDGGFSVRVPMLPGLYTQGDSYEEALANARAAIAFHLECLRAEGETIPVESDAPHLERVEVA
jgi:predicted RNase H-like HicB family nuclease